MRPDVSRVECSLGIFEFLRAPRTSTESTSQLLAIVSAFYQSNQRTITIFSSLSFSGLVRSRDGSHLSPNTQPFISLPSPNIQSAKVRATLVKMHYLMRNGKRWSTCCMQQDLVALKRAPSYSFAEFPSRSLRKFIALLFPGSKKVSSHFVVRLWSFVAVALSLSVLVFSVRTKLDPLDREGLLARA